MGERVGMGDNTEMAAGKREYACAESFAQPEDRALSS